MSIWLKVMLKVVNYIVIYFLKIKKIFKLENLVKLNY